MNAEKINGYGAVLRFITPILIVLIGFLGRMAIEDVKYQLKDLNMHFTNHLSDHKQLELILERRLTRIETIIGGKYGAQ